MKKITIAQHAHIHAWLKSNYGYASQCTNKECLHTTNRYHWCLIHGKKYEKNINNFKELCQICHAAYDAKRRKLNKISLMEDGKITVLVPDDFKLQVKLKALSKRTTPSKVMRTLLEKWLKEK